MPKSRSSTRKKSQPPLDDAVIGALIKSGVAEENARIVAALVLSTVGTYDPHKRVATAAQAAVEETAKEIEAADPSKVGPALTEASREATAQKGGAFRWNTALPAGYTMATAAMQVVAMASVQAIKHILRTAGCDSRVINIACYMIPCLLFALPEVIVPGAVPGLSYMPVEPTRPAKEHAE